MRCLPLLLVLPLALAAADGGGKPHALNGGADAAKADARRTFAQQAEGSDAVTPTGKAPVITGLFLWNGRADGNYKPFYQWECRLMAGSAAAQDVQVRVHVLGPLMQVLHTGPWKALGTISAGKTQDVEYRLNCPAPTAYRVDVTWQGGADTFLGWDRVMVPTSEGALADQACLACVGGTADSDGKQGATAVQWWLWNIGGQPVPAGATVSIRFLNDQGLPVHQELWKQPANEVLAPHSAKERRLVIRKKLPTDVLSFQAQVPAGNRSTAPITVDGLEVSQVQQRGELLSVHLRNVGPAPFTDLALSLGLMNAQGAKVTTVTMPATTLAVGAEATLTSAVAKGIAWQTYELTWTQANGTP